MYLLPPDLFFISDSDFPMLLPHHNLILQAAVISQDTQEINTTCNIVQIKAETVFALPGGIIRLFDNSTAYIRQVNLKVSIL